MEDISKDQRNMVIGEGSSKDFFFNSLIWRMGEMDSWLEMLRKQGQIGMVDGRGLFWTWGQGLSNHCCTESHICWLYQVSIMSNSKDIEHYQPTHDQCCTDTMMWDWLRSAVTRVLCHTTGSHWFLSATFSQIVWYFGGAWVVNGSDHIDLRSP